MRAMLLLSIILAATGNVFAMNVPEATETSIINDCSVTAELSVMLLKMKAKTPPENLFQSAKKLLKDKGYQGSFGNLEFVAGMYTGSALQMGSEVDQVMASVNGEDLEIMISDHQMTCLEKAMTELTEKKSSNQPQPK